MRLRSAHVRNFKSIEDSDNVLIDGAVTVLVGQNESGKTAFLKALNKAYSVEKGVRFDVVEDYPRKNLNAYEPRHAAAPADVVTLSYELVADEIASINTDLDFELVTELQFSITHLYDNTRKINLTLDEQAFVKHLVACAKLSTEVASAARKTKTLRELVQVLSGVDLNTEEKAFLDATATRFAEPKSKGWSLLDYYVWATHLQPRIPKFLYFDDYKLLPGKINLRSLQARVQVSESTNPPKLLSDEDQTVLALLRIARIELNDIAEPGSYEKSKARLEGISNSITDQVFKFWTQNKQLEVQFDIKEDPADQPPFNNGHNLYIRIRNQRHRVSVPFDQRSKGFIWFFSFLVWFDSISEQIDAGTDLILLLDEPGLSLHALAQLDFLRYIDELSSEHQILYTTHSPFMIHDNRLHQVRTVEDLPEVGTKVSENLTGSDPKTIFPLQAALGYTIAQNLFIAKRNLLVEGPADLLYLKFMGSLLEQKGRTTLRDDLTVVPVGGLDKLATFVALLAGNELEMTVLHDYKAKPDARLQSLVEEKLIRDRQVMHYGMFRDGKKSTSAAGMKDTDVEDLFAVDFYLQLFSATFKKELASKTVAESDLPPGDRVVDRLTRWLVANGVTLRPSGGFNHYRVANHLIANPGSKLEQTTLSRFQLLFETVNARYSE